jgi:DHA1 family tetracycline resistance protein-like MFS transporter
MLGLSLFAIASQPWMLYVFILVYCLGGIAPPSLQAIISGRVHVNEQGELQGIITSLISLSNILAPLIMSHLFYFFTKENTAFNFPGAPFAVAAFLVSIGIVLCIRELKKANRL